MTDTTAVIDWDEAMQQCGDDEEFLRELLSDLRSETDTQMAMMEEIIQNPSDGNPFIQICRAAHVIKGAASNLMCPDLRKTSMDLESAATAANVAENENENQELLDEVKEKFESLKLAVENYHAHLKELDV